MELNSGFGLEKALQVCDLALNDPNYSVMAQSEFLSKKGQVHRYMARAHLFTDREKALQNHKQAVRYYLQATDVRYQRGLDESKVSAWTEDTFSEFIGTVVRYRVPVDVLDFLKAEIGNTYAVAPLVSQILRFVSSLPAYDGLGEATQIRAALGGLRGKLQSKAATNVASDDKARILDAIEVASKKI
jgi:hypothetical protein